MAYKVLLVDDSPAILKIIRIFMMGTDLEFFEATDAQRALQLLRVTRFDLVITDINMPDIDGIELTRRIRADPRNSGVKIVLLTGERAAELRDVALAAGANDFVEKPVTAHGIRGVINAVLGVSTEVVKPGGVS